MGATIRPRPSRKTLQHQIRGFAAECELRASMTQLNHNWCSGEQLAM